jgi:glycosyltransferase involved in cell wall biosynthesis
MARLGLYHEFAPREELERWLSSADAFLVTSAFEPGMRRLMETNFPSKLLEFARFGKPLVVWGPDYSTLIQWAQPGSRGLCITSPDPGELVNALRKLAASYTEQQRLAREASDAMKAEFDPAAIQQQFLQAIQDAVVGKIPRIRAATGNEPNSGVFQASLERVAPARVL